MRAASDRIVPVSLELGGKSPSIVFPDANEDWVVDGIIAAMRFTRQSQSCTAGSRLFLHRNIFDNFLDSLSQRVKALKLGDPLDKVCGYVEEGLNRPEARVVIGGLPPKEGRLSEGYYAVPTIFANVENDWRLAREEIFGPVLRRIRSDKCHDRRNQNRREARGRRYRRAAVNDSARRNGAADG